MASDHCPDESFYSPADSIPSTRQCSPVLSIDHDSQRIWFQKSASESAIELLVI
jgi:hypothetical protein